MFLLLRPLEILQQRETVESEVGILRNPMEFLIIYVRTGIVATVAEAEDVVTAAGAEAEVGVVAAGTTEKL